MKNLFWLCTGCLIGLSIKKPSEPKYVIKTSNDGGSIETVLKTKEAEKAILKVLMKHNCR